MESCNLIKDVSRNVRSMIGESTDFTSQAVAFGYLGLAFGVGTVLGASLESLQTAHPTPACMHATAGIFQFIMHAHKPLDMSSQGLLWEAPYPCPVRILDRIFLCAGRGS